MLRIAFIVSVVFVLGVTLLSMLFTPLAIGWTPPPTDGITTAITLLIYDLQAGAVGVVFFYRRKRDPGMAPAWPAYVLWGSYAAGVFGAIQDAGSTFAPLSIGEAAWGILFLMVQLGLIAWLAFGRTSGPQSG